MNQESGLHELARFIVSGGFGFLLYLLFATLLGHFGSLGQGTSAFLATLLAISPTFLMQRAFTFRSEGRLPRQFASYLLLQLISSVVIGLVAHAGSAVGMQPTLGYIVAGVVGVAGSYLVQSLLIFRR